MIPLPREGLSRCDLVPLLLKSCFCAWVQVLPGAECRGEQEVVPSDVPLPDDKMAGSAAPLPRNIASRTNTLA